MSVYNPRALVVDDDESIRLMIGKIIEREGFLVDIACDGAEAIEKISEREYDLVLLDLMMPRADGFTALREIAQRCPGQLESVLVMTALPREYLGERLPAVIHKPFDIEELLLRVRNVRSIGIARQARLTQCAAAS